MRVNGIFAALPSRHGHFLLESGYHTDLWFTLDAVFVKPEAVAPFVAALADRLQAHGISSVCGPLQGGAFLAQALSGVMGLGFYYAEPTAPSSSGLFAARYRLPAELRRRVQGQRVAVVDDVISAGSSVRATMAALDEAGAVTVVVGALLLLGDAGLLYFAGQRIPVESLARREFNLWHSTDCPLCRSGVLWKIPATKQSAPQSRGDRERDQHVEDEIAHQVGKDKQRDERPAAFLHQACPAQGAALVSQGAEKSEQAHRH